MKIGLLLLSLALVGGKAHHPLDLRWLHMVDARHGYAVSGVDYRAYRLLRTADGGRTWTDITPGNGTIHPSGAATVAGRTIVFGTQRGPSLFAVERSDDGGRTWRMSGTFRDVRPAGIGPPMLLDSQHLYVALGEGAAAGSEAESLWASSDGGRTWRFVSRTDITSRKAGALPFGCDKNGYGFVTPAVGWATGFCPGGAPFIYRTSDGGKSWRRASLPGLTSCQCDVSTPTFFDRREGVIAVRGNVSRLYWTTDGGSSWRASSPPAGNAYGDSVPDARTAWLETRDHVVATGDAGRTWRSAGLPFDPQQYQLDAVSSTTAFAYGGRTVLTTVDGGSHWQGLPRGSSCPLQQPATLRGSSVALVRPGAASVVLCRYSAGLVAAARVTGNLVVRLTNELDALQTLPVGIHCPLDDGSAIVATFRYAHASSNPVRIGLRGCNAATNGPLTLRATPAVLQRLERITEPAKPTRPCTNEQLGVSVQTQGENTTAWIGVTVENRGAACVARRVPVTIAVERNRLTLHASGRLYHSGTQLLVADWSNWCGTQTGVRVAVTAGDAEAVAPVRVLPVCLQRGRRSRLVGSH